MSKNKKAGKKLVHLESAESVSKNPNGFVDKLADEFVKGIQKERKKMGLPPLPKE